MRRATLLVNPAAGRAALLRGQMDAVEAVLAGHGYAADVVETSAVRDSAATLAAEAARSAALVLACGGDGTVHGAVQGLARTGVALGVVPLGTANALARNLGIPLDPLAAIARLLTYTPRLIPLGEMGTPTETRLFAVLAGCGPDGLLIHELSQAGGARLKARFGRSAYYAHAARLFVTRRWPVFQVSYRKAGAEAWESADAVAVMASRVPDLGGLFSGLTGSASVTQASLRVQILRAPAQVSMPAWMLCARLGVGNPWLTTVDVEELRCTALDARAVYAQADGEPMGALPVSLRLVAEGLRLLMPG